MKDVLLRVIPVVLVAALWEIAPRLGWVHPEFLPSLSDVTLAWAHQIATGELPYHAIASLANCAAGLAGGIILGVALGVLMAWHPLLNAIVGPLVQMTYPIPRSALVPVMILWFGLGAAACCRSSSVPTMGRAGLTRR
jgi:NitT/TauT family transport system permease protein